MRPYNNQTIDAKIKEINPDIIRVGDYEGSIIKIKFRHNKCGYEWYIEPYLIISKKINCAKCVLRIRNNLDIDCYILQNNLPLTRIGDYIGAYTPIDFKCNNCNATINIVATSLKRQQGCWTCKFNKNIDFLLKDKNLIRLDSYIDADSKMQFKCLICSEICKTTPSQIKRGAGCIYCAGKVKLTNEKFDQYLVDNNISIKRIDDYLNIKTPMLCECIECNYIWKVLPGSIRSGHGCPRCVGRLKWTNKDVDNFIIENKIPLIRIGDYIGSHSKIDFQCVICSKIWTTQPSALKKGSRCLHCIKHYSPTNEEYDQQLIDSNISSIIRTGNYINSSTSIDFKCLICNYIWQAIPNNIKKHSGCPNCYGNFKWNNILLDAYLKDNNIHIIRIGEYINTSTPILFQCKQCDLKWKTRPGCLKRRKRCPKCSCRYNEKLVLELLTDKCFDIKYQYTYYLDYNIYGINKIRVDFYIEKYNLIIEYNGIQHYKPTCFGNQTAENSVIAFEKQKNRDNVLRKFVADNQINLLEIDGRIYTDDILKDFVNQYFIDININE